MSSGKKLACLLVVIIGCIIGYNAIKATVETINAFKVSQSPSITVGMVTDISTKTTTHKYKHGGTHSSLKYYASIMYSVDGEIHEAHDKSVDSNTKTGDTLTLYYTPSNPDLVYLEQPGFGLLIWDVVIVLVMYALTVGSILVLRRIYHSEHVASERQMDRLVQRAQMRQQMAESARQFYTDDAAQAPAPQDNSVQSTKEESVPWEK